ncbi:transcription factor SII homolog [Elysia marginata]|uniref:Transcription factor SII homolog n=1 Tax=Elysia marginata TaxID=1093978 RepID=A0AAV4GVZ6_9GAST|nr:transcription factor SII homolog [Elysia marginata]
MNDPETAQLRAGVRTLIDKTLRKSLPVNEHGRVPGLAGSLEQASFDAAQYAGTDHWSRYATIYNGLIKALPERYGDFLEDTLAGHIASGRMTEAEATAAETYEAYTQHNPRRQGRALFYSILSQDPRFDAPREEKRRSFASEIERGCYNAAIARCVNSADAYHRQWSSPMFVAVYSARVGLVSANIDPAGSVLQNVESSTWALDKLAEGEWRPEALGAMTDTELCPQAGQAERDKVHTRINQKINEKTSSFFACPRCRKRNHTYRQIQVRSADEISTFMCTCKECGENYEGHA